MYCPKIFALTPPATMVVSIVVASASPKPETSFGFSSDNAALDPIPSINGRITRIDKACLACVIVAVILVPPIFLSPAYCGGTNGDLGIPIQAKQHLPDTALWQGNMARSERGFPGYRVLRLKFAPLRGTRQIRRCRERANETGSNVRLWL